MPSRPAPSWNVYRNGIIAAELQPIKVVRSLGGDRLDYAELIVDTKKMPSFNGLDDFSAFPWLGHTLEIGFSTGGYVHRGTIVQACPRFNQSEAAIVIISRTEHHLFGRPLFGQVHFNPINGEFFHGDHPLIFNPTIDGKTYGNKHDNRNFGSQQMPIFLEPEATRTEAARTLQGGENVSWLLSEVLYYLCWMSNPDQTFLVNPTLAELQSSVMDSVDLVRDLNVKHGSTLPEALDAILGGMGYFWRLVQVGAFSLNKIEIIRRSTGGALTWLNHQRLGTSLNTSATNTEAMGVRFDTSTLANQVLAKGGNLQVEITAELHRGWPADLDDEPLESLKKSVASRSENPEKLNAWRKWVLNEAGDYIGTREEITNYLTDDLRDMLQAQDLLRWFLPRRRKLLPTLTTKLRSTEPIGNVASIYIEYRDYDGSWQPVKDWGIQILERECGILIDAPDVPEELYDQGESAAIRVTATIEADYRLTYTANKQADSPIFGLKEQYIELDESYQHRMILEGSKFAGSENGSIAADDRFALQTFVNSLRERLDQIDVPGGITLEGLEWFPYYQPGDRVRGVEGKNISFEVRKGSNQYPQIVSVTLDIENQKTILQLQRFREFRAG